MEQIIKLKYFNPVLKIGLTNWKIVYLLEPVIKQLYPEVDKGRLVYRARGSGRRISYNSIKSGLVKKESIIKEEVPDWLNPAKYKN